jgi:4-hydroxy-2-oxoheptanedioate aldolase
MTHPSPLDNGNLKTRVQSGLTSFGTFIGMNATLSAEIAALSGADWVLLDLEHGAGSEDQIGPVVLSSGGYGVPTIVRVESEARIRIGKALDAGAAGIMVPRLETLDQVKQIVNHMVHPPHGDRGVATYNRAASWGKHSNPFPETSQALCLIQIENTSALEIVEDIAAVDGVDVLFVGPLDLSFALGKPRDFKNQVFIDACDRVVAAAKKNKKVAGILASDVETAKNYQNMGFDFIAIGSDSTVLLTALSNIFEQVKKS